MTLKASSLPASGAVESKSPASGHTADHAFLSPALQALTDINSADADQQLRDNDDARREAEAEELAKLRQEFAIAGDRGGTDKNAFAPKTITLPSGAVIQFH